MRSPLTILLVAVLLAVTTLDRIACPDGCTDSADDHSAPTALACTWCNGCSGPATESLQPNVVVAAWTGPTDISFERSPFLPAIEHPPKTAPTR